MKNDFFKILPKDEYLIINSFDQYFLQDSLKHGKLVLFDSPYPSADDNIYLVMIHIFNTNKRVLVYSYVSYYYMLHHTLYAFLLNRCVTIGPYTELGNLLCIMDKDTSPIGMDNRYLDNAEYNNLHITNNIDSLIKYYKLNNFYLTYNESFKLINKLVVIKDMDSIIKLINFSFDKEKKIILLAKY